MPDICNPLSSQTDDLLVACSSFITVMGALTNLLSISFYISVLCRAGVAGGPNTTEKLTKWILVLLNSYDIVVCVSLIVYFFLQLNCVGMRDLAVAVFLYAVQCTGFMTCLLAVYRTITILWPHYVIKNNYIAAIIGAFGTFFFALDAAGAAISVHLEVKDRYHEPQSERIIKAIQFIIYVIIFLTIVISNTICVKQLLSGCNIAAWKKQATITMGLLSVNYCVFNIGFVVQSGFVAFKCDMDTVADVCIGEVADKVIMFVLLPLNSACNPVVYLSRDSKMRRFIGGWCGRLCGVSDRSADSSVRSAISRIGDGEGGEEREGEGGGGDDLRRTGGSSCSTACINA